MNSKFPFSLSDFKKVDANRDHTVMQSPEGHLIHVSHKALTKEMHDALRKLPVQKMSRGGIVGYAQGGAVKPQPTPPPPPQPEGPISKETNQQFLKGFKLMADGGVVGQHDQDADNDSIRRMQAMLGEDTVGGKVAAAESGTAAPAPSEAGNLDPAVLQQFQTGMPAYQKPVGQMYPGPMDAIKGIGNLIGQTMSAPGVGSVLGVNDAQAAVTPPDQVEQQTAPDLTPAVPPQAQGGGSSAMTIPGQDPALTALDKVEQGAEGEAKALKASATDQAKYLGDALTTLKQQQMDQQARQADLMAHNDKLAEEMAKTDPSIFTTQKSLGGRLASAVGIMLGGGLVVNAINGYLDQEVAAQRASYDQKDTLFKINEKRLGDSKAAADMTKMNLLTLLELQTKQRVQQGVAASAMPAMQKNLGEIALKKAELLEKIQQRQNMLSSSANMKDASPMKIGQFIDTMIPEPMRKQAYEELGNLQSGHEGSAQAMRGFQEVKNLNSSLASLPLTESGAKFDSIKASLLTNVVKSLGGNPSDRDMKVINQMLPTWKDMLSPRKDAILSTKSRIMQDFIRDKQKQNKPTPLLDSRGISLAMPASSNFQGSGRKL